MMMMVLFQILLDGAEPRDAGKTWVSLQSAGGEANRILLASVLSSMRIICQHSVSRRDWIIAVSLGCFVSLRTSSFRTNWYHSMPSSIRRHHWSSASVIEGIKFWWTKITHSQINKKYGDISDDRLRQRWHYGVIEPPLTKSVTTGIVPKMASIDK